MKNYSFIIKGQKYDVQINNFEDNIADLEVNGTSYKVELQTAAQPKVVVQKTPQLVRKPVEIKEGEGTIKKTEAPRGIYELKSPLPGSIFKLLVSVGDRIIKGQTVLVMEAMKMENNIQTEKEGIVKEIKVKIGDAVLQNDTLIIVE